MKLRWSHAIVGATILLTVWVGNGAVAGGLSATLNGTPISLERAATLSCHDFDYPVLRCFTTASAMEVDAARRAGELRARAAGADSLTSVGYVTAFEHALYAGAAVGLSTNQPWLGSLGWNDRISSFKSFGATGNFQENSPGGGFVFSFAATTTVPSLNGTYNDKFSSFFIN